MPSLCLKHLNKTSFKVHFRLLVYDAVCCMLQAEYYSVENPERKEPSPVLAACLCLSVL